MHGENEIMDVQWLLRFTNFNVQLSSSNQIFPGLELVPGITLKGWGRKDQWEQGGP